MTDGIFESVSQRVARENTKKADPNLSLLFSISLQYLAPHKAAS